MRKLTKHRLFAALPALAALCFLASCASSSPESGNPETPAASSDGALLDGSSKASSDSNAFGDLATPETPAAAAPVEPPPATAGAPAAEGDTYYNSYGGESLRRVALTLFSDKAFARKLLDRNPDLKGVKKLTAEQKVFFEMDVAKPEPRYLTKDLLARYPDQLAARIQSVTSEKGLAKSEVTVAKGESLQDLSQRLYGSHRYWPEIYLVNRDKLQNYDKVKAGMTLTVVSHPEAAAKAESAPAVARTEEPAAPPPVAEEAPKEVKPLPVVAPVAVLPPPEPVKEPEPPVAIQPPPAPPADPVPDTSVPPPAPAPIAEKAPAPVEPAPIPKVLEPMPAVAARVDANEPASANSSLRRGLYVVLILMIGGAAFYFTRTPKRPKIDILDLNADPAGGRQKLAAAPKDSQRDQLG